MNIDHILDVFLILRHFQEDCDIFNTQVMFSK